MTKFKFLFALVFVSLVFISCDPSDGTPSLDDDAFANNFGNVVNRDFLGQVADHLGQPISNALVTIGTSTAYTDANGVFIIHGASVYEKFAYIIATKAGYMTVTNSLIPTSGKNFVRMLMDTPDSFYNLTIESGIASQIGYPPLQGYVNFDGAFEDSSGNAYSGAVDVNFIDMPPQYSSEEYFPGMLYGKREDGSQASLNEIFGLLKVDLQGSAGQHLNLANGHTAEMAMKIAVYQMPSAPSTIPLWYFDKEVGYWKEEGFATKVGDYYIGNVSHFSWWACSTASPSVRLTFTMIDPSGNPLSNVPIELVNSEAFHDQGVTDENGQFTGLLPAGQSITLNVRGGCEGIAYSTSIGPYISDANVPPITLNSSTHIVGTLLKCDSTNVTNGYIVVNKAGMISISEVSSGNFNLNEIFCASDTAFRLKGVDYDNFQESDVLSGNFSPSVTNVGNLHTCTSPDEFFRYQIDTNPAVILTNIHTGMEFGFNVSAYIPSGVLTAETMWVNLPAAVGTYTTSTCSIQCDNTGDINSTTLNTMQFTITAFGPIGGFVDINFTGTYVDASAISHTLSGQAHVRRDE